MKALLLLSLLSSVSAFANSTYDCTLTGGGNGAHEQTIVIAGNTATVSADDKMNGLFFSATKDPSYKPKGAPKVRFVGQEKGNSRKLVVDAAMVSGTHRGYASIIGDEDGYWEASYDCSAK